jgi:hypothetical protein
MILIHGPRFQVSLRTQREAKAGKTSSKIRIAKLVMNKYLPTGQFHEQAIAPTDTSTVIPLINNKKSAASENITGLVLKFSCR